MGRQFNYRKLLFRLADLCILAMSGISVTFFMVHKNMIAFSTSKENIFTVVIFAFLGIFGLSTGGEYRKAWKFIGRNDYISCTVEILLSTVLSAVLMYFSGNAERMFTSVNAVFYIYWFLCFFISTFFIVLLRIAAKHSFIYLVNAGQSEVMKNVIILGAGSAGRMIAIEIKNALLEGNIKKYNYSVIGFIDDDPNIINSKIDGVRVLGTTEELEKICREYNIDIIFFAIPSCTNRRKAEILQICSNVGCEVRVVPELSSLINNKNIIGQASNVRVEDLLGRDPVTLDTEKLNGFINNRICMVTGGGGSIGSELCRQIMKYNPRMLIIVDIYENNAYDIQQELIMNGIADTDNLKVLIASVRDYDKMEEIFKKYKPELVFHAAAHKHVPLMETSPEEAVKNNIFGTYNVASLSDKYKVKKFVLISTDKAVNPANVMGATKRCCEMIVQHFSTKSKNTDYAAVRFGNVLGSNGSVIPLFKRQIESGNPVTVTDPNVVRYFMTIPEAVSLVLEAGAMAHNGKIFVLDMGEPVKILTLAENLIKLYGMKPYEDVKIIFTTLRPGEKIYEELLMNEEGLQQTDNKKIYIGAKIDFDDDQFMNGLNRLKELSSENDSDGVVKELEELVPTFKHALNK